MTGTSFAQESVKQKEHQAVIDYFNKIYPTYPVNKSNANPGIDKYKARNLWKTSVEERSDWKNYIMNGNNVSVQVWNYGMIGGGLPGDALRDILGMVWHDSPYIFAFSPIVGASIPNALDPSKKFHIVTDGLYDFSYTGLRDENTSTDHQYWWQPLPGFADPNQEFIASNPAFDSDKDGKPDSWPRDWYNSTLGEYVWPGYLVQGQNNSDLELLWGMDDRENNEFSKQNQAAQYYPFVSDSSRSGLGIQVLGRAYQWSNSLAANSVFFQYTLTNVSDKDLDSVFFGIYGDPDVGGKDNKDDNGLFIPPYDYDGNHPVDNIPVYARSMVYFFDPDMTGDLGKPLGYLGCKFLESPGNPDDGIDNDGDGMVDESQFDGIDNDNDWNPETDDVGVDGIPNTGDQGEGDGVPTSGRLLADGSIDPLAPGEPNFEYTDLDEADQIGLTSFNSSTWNTDLKVSNDEDIWNRCVPQNFGDITQNADIVFIFGSGYISLKKGESKRISMAFLFGENLNDLLVTAETVQDIYNKNYNFFKPPTLPKVTAVPGDRKVTLYWDNSAEQSVDPITGKDFEGYTIYRSTRPDFADDQVVTDGHASSFLYEPLRDVSGFEAKWDLVNEWKGYHPVPYLGRGVHYYLGDNTGLVHSFVDSNNVINGQTYYYAVAAYDHGDSLGIPPTETTKKITVDNITSTITLDDNTAMVIPGPRVSGYEEPNVSNLDFQQLSGTGNGKITFHIFNDLDVKDEKYTILFSDSLNDNGTMKVGKNFSIAGENPITESFYLFDNKFTSLSKQYIINDGSIKVTDNNGVVYLKDTDYIIDYANGKIRRADNSTIPNNKQYNITYHYYAVFQSQALKGEDSNPVFDGIKIKVVDYPALVVDTSKTKWVEGNSNYNINVRKGSVGSGTLYPADYEITFSSNYIDSTYLLISGKLFRIPSKFSVKTTNNSVQNVETILVENSATKDSLLSSGEEIVFFKPNAAPIPQNLTWGVVLSDTTADTTGIAPSDGDVLRISTNRPFTKEDSFSFITEAGKVDQQKGEMLLSDIYVVPNPYVGTSVLEPDNKLPNQNRGERRIYFENLPMKCTIRIFTLSGELVTTLVHESGMDNGREYWNLLNRDGFSVAYGVYLAHIEAPGIGNKLVKFALIK